MELGVEQPDPRLAEAMPTRNFVDSEMEDPRTERSGERYDQPVSSGSEESSTVETAKSDAANVKDTAAGAASGSRTQPRAKSPTWPLRPSIQPGAWWTRRGLSCGARLPTSSRTSHQG